MIGFWIKIKLWCKEIVLCIQQWKTLFFGVKSGQTRRIVFRTKNIWFQCRFSGLPSENPTEIRKMLRNISRMWYSKSIFKTTVFLTFYKQYIVVIIQFIMLIYGSLRLIHSVAYSQEPSWRDVVSHHAALFYLLAVSLGQYFVGIQARYWHTLCKNEYSQFWRRNKMKLYISM